MNNSSCIYWFSGTGNSLYTAKKIAAALDIPLSRITDETPAGSAGGHNQKIGFVFPSYYGNLPRAVRTFAEKLDINPDTYIFTIVTMGALGQGSVHAMKKLLKNKGLHLSYGKCLLMPANYVLNYNPADPAKSIVKMEKTDELIKKFAANIMSGVQSAKTLPFTAGNLYKNIEKLDAGFTVNSSCTGCDLCRKMCPVRNIKLEDRKPKWLGHCEHCVACISWCPVKAINYGNKTQTRRRYRFPGINADDLTRRD